MELPTTAYVILGMLSIEPGLSGYDIHQSVETTVGYFWGESFGQIYPALKRLAALGLIAPCPPSPHAEAAPSGRRRQAWQMTPEGRRALGEWLALPFRNEPPRNEFLLKLFFAREAAPGVALAHVREVQSRNQKMLAALQAIEKQAAAQRSPSPHQPYWMLTLTLGMALTEAALAWGERTLQALPSLDAAHPEASASPAQPGKEAQ